MPGLTPSQMRDMIPGVFRVEDVKSLVRALPEGEKLVYTIAASKIQLVGMKEEEKPTITFAETKKYVVMNGGRSDQLQAIYGDKDPVGKRVALDVDKINGKEQIILLAP